MIARVLGSRLVQNVMVRTPGTTYVPADDFLAFDVQSEDCSAKITIDEQLRVTLRGRHVVQRLETQKPPPTYDEYSIALVFDEAAIWPALNDNQPHRFRKELRADPVTTAGAAYHSTSDILQS